jgi:hypothetical protein
MRPIRTLAAALLAAIALTPAQAADQPARAAAAAGAPVADKQPAQARRIDVAAEAARIDALVDAGLKAHGLKPNADLNDEAFLRRIYLDAIGRIPTLAEYKAFLDDPTPKRRATLIAKLLGSEGWVSREFNWWADLLRVETQPQKKHPGEPYVDWLKQAIREDMPYDQLVTALLTAKGAVMERGNGATGYYVRDAGMPQDNMSFTVQVFLGTRVACAQCHDHPFDKWTRLQYMQMSAYTANVQESADPDFIKALRRIIRADGGEPTQFEKQALQRLGQTVKLEVRPSTSDATPLPKDYQYANGKPGQQVRAHTLFGGDASSKKGEDPRGAYASWMTSPDNPRFTMVMANRQWKKVMGLGLIEPLDNFTDATVAAEPELMDHLTGLLKDCAYDIRKFQEVLYSTKAYQRAATAKEITPGDEYWFPGPALRRLGAEQVWDSLLTMVIPDVDERKGVINPETLYAAYDDYKDKTPKDLWGTVENVVDAVKKRDEIQAKLKEAMAKFPDKRDAAKDPEVRELRQQLGDLQMEAQGLGYLKKRQSPETDPRWKGYPRDLVRASEVQSPAPPGHFLRDFGQSDRQLVDNANPSPAVPQALTLLNGIVDQRILRPEAVLMKTLEPIGGQENKIRAAFAMILCRQPTARELDVFMQAGTGRPQGLGDLVWTLINSREFLFIQ